ncbi:IS5 family transposase [Eubacteriales bacterium OttesenSCG-928-A19]|nr:IS5 family transposase [Eubacteriales bacterium OttesenSCG-928-A19]
MKLTEAQYAEISECFPKHRRKASISNLEILNAVLYVLENGCKWRCLPKEYGNWNTIYVRLRRWSKSGVLQRAFLLLQEKNIIQVSVKIISLDSTSIKVHPDGTGAFKKHGKQAIGNSRGGRNTKLHMVAASDRDAVTFFLSSGEAGDAPQGRKLLSTLGNTSRQVYLLMDRAYEGNATRDLASQMGYIPVVPPKSNRKNPWVYDKSLYKVRNQVERLFRRIKRFRRIFTRYDKLDIMFVTFIFLALVADAL